VNNTGEAIQTFQSAVSQVFNLQALDTPPATLQPLINLFIHSLRYVEAAVQLHQKANLDEPVQQLQQGIGLCGNDLRYNY